MNKTIDIKSFSSHLFWDTDISQIDFDKHQKFIIKKVLQYGFYNDWKLLLKTYGLKTIIKHAITIKDIDKKTLAFLSVISETPKKEFLCYTIEQSTQKHWNF